MVLSEHGHRLVRWKAHFAASMMGECSGSKRISWYDSKASDRGQQKKYSEDHGNDQFFLGPLEVGQVGELSCDLHRHMMTDGSQNAGYSWTCYFSREDDDKTG